MTAFLKRLALILTSFCLLLFLGCTNTTKKTSSTEKRSVLSFESLNPSNFVNGYKVKAFPGYIQLQSGGGISKGSSSTRKIVGVVSILPYQGSVTQAQDVKASLGPVPK